jgi:hypothetical protein
MAVRKGSPVWVRDGKYHNFRVDGRNVTARELFKALAERYDTIHFMDIDGITEREPDLDLLRDLCYGSTSVVADIGVAYSEMVIDAIMAGASDAVISTKTVLSLDEIASAYELTENIVLEVVLEGGRVVSQDSEVESMAPEEFVKEMALLGIERYILVQTDPAAEPLAMSVDRLLGPIPKGGELWADLDSPHSMGELAAKVHSFILSSSKLVGGME